MAVMWKNLNLDHLASMSIGQIASLLERSGVSEVGKKAVLSNCVNGEMFIEFDENDVKDLFFEKFSDRFIVRKIISKYQSIRQTLDAGQRSPELVDGSSDFDDSSNEFLTSPSQINNETESDLSLFTVQQTLLQSALLPAWIQAFKDNMMTEQEEISNSPQLTPTISVEQNGEMNAETEPATDMSTPSPPKSSNSRTYNADELLRKKPKMGAPSAATHYFLTVMREVATAVGLWDRAPDMRAIPQHEKDTFLRGVYDRLPCLSGNSQEIMHRLAQALQNRRKYLRDVVSGKRKLRMLQQNLRKQIKRRELQGNQDTSLSLLRGDTRRSNQAGHSTASNGIGEQFYDEGMQYASDNYDEVEFDGELIKEELE